MVETFDIVYADCPWWYTPNHTMKLPYSPMKEEALSRFPVGELLHKKSWLLCWVTCSHVFGMQSRIFDVWKARYKLHFRGIFQVWTKTRADGELLGATGGPPTLVKPQMEFVAAFSQTKNGRPQPIANMKERHVVAVPRPSNEHSRKPVEVAERIERLFPSQSKIELFARGAGRPNWKIWGNETVGENVLAWDPFNNESVVEYNRWNIQHKVQAIKRLQKELQLLLNQQQNDTTHTF